MQIIDIYLTAYGGATVWFADNQALQGSLIHTLKVGQQLLLYKKKKKEKKRKKKSQGGTQLSLYDYESFTQEVRPTRFFGVPRVWEKIQEKMMEVSNKKQMKKG